MENDYILLKRIRDILFYLFVTTLMLFLSFFIYIDCFAMSTGDSPNEIKANLINGSAEYYNVYSNGIFFEPRDSGNALPYFNRESIDNQFFDYDPLNPPSHYYAVDNLDYRFSGSNTPKTITVSLYYYGYDWSNDSWHLHTTENFVIDELWSTLISSPRKVDYQTTSGLKSSNMRYISSTYIGNGGRKYTYQFDMLGSNGYVWIKQLFGSQHKSIAFTGGIHIDNVEDWNGVVDTQALIDNNNQNTQAIINNANTNHKSLIGKIGDIINIITNGFTNLPSYIWSFFSGGFNTITNFLSSIITGIGNIFSSIQDIFSDDTPTSQYISEYLESFVINSDNIILEFVTLPIQFLTTLISSTSCSTISLGTLFGYTLTIPCLRSIIFGFLGNDLYNIITTLVTIMIYWRLCVFVKSNLDKVLELSLDINETFNIDL